MVLFQNITKKIRGETVERLLKQAKKFIPDLRKCHTRPILQTILVTEKHIIATDSHRLIRIKHNGEISKGYLYHFDPVLTGNLTVDMYPKNIERVIPDEHAAKINLESIDVKEWISIFEQAWIAAKVHENKCVCLSGEKVYVDPARTKWTYCRKKKEYVEVKVPLFEQIRFICETAIAEGVESTTYNCKYVLDALKVFKFFKETPSFHWYGNLRPSLLVSENIEVVILPIRTS